jgi:DNA gyrase/topoisomerase IV subunit A
LVVTKKGRINKFLLSALTPHKRATCGNNVIKLEKGDSIFSIYGVNNNNHLRAVTTNGIVEIPVSEIKERSAVAVGDKGLIKGTLIRINIF